MRKHHILYTVAISILLSFAYTNSSTSALSYENSVGIGFTFNPTLSISLNSSDLVISNLAPGSSSDSNSINVSAATNASYGYTLSVNASSDYLTHSNNVNTFSSIATNANLSNLDDSEDNNIWGYSTSLDNGTTWSNYNGLSSSSTTLLDTNTNNTVNGIDTIDFKIGAKAGSTQPSGTYTNTINFIAVSKVAPMSLLDSFIASGATQLNGYFKMQDMTHDICQNVDIEESELQLIDVRDNKIYWIAKLKDGNCWMTQNLDLDLYSSVVLTSDNTDLSTDTSLYVQNSTNGPYALNSSYTINTVDNKTIVSWTPERSTIAYNQLSNTTWVNDNSHPYSYDKLNSDGTPSYPDSIVTKAVAGNHALSGNYYNWTAAIASNDSGSLTGNNANNISNNPKNSICSKGWRLPTISNMANNITNSTNEFSRLNLLYNNNSTDSASSLISYPLYFIRSGFINNGTSSYVNSSSYYLSSTPGGSTNAWVLLFGATGVIPNRNDLKSLGFSLRCIAR